MTTPKKITLYASPEWVESLVADPRHTTARRVSDGPRRPNAAGTLDTRGYIWAPSARIAVADAIWATVGVFDALAAINFAGSYTEAQAVLLLAVNAAGFTALSFRLHAAPAVRDYRESELERIAPPEPVPVEIVVHPDIEAKAPTQERAFEIKIGGCVIARSEAANVIEKSEAGKLRMSRADFADVTNNKYSAFFHALSARGFAENRGGTQYHWTPEGIEWLRRMHKHTTPLGRAVIRQKSAVPEGRTDGQRDGQQSRGGAGDVIDGIIQEFSE